MNDWLHNISPPVRRGLQGALLALGSPGGWYITQIVSGAPLWHISAQLQIYVYLTVGTVLAFAGFGWALGRREQRLETLNKKLEQRAITDELTGLRNSRYFWERATDEVDHARRAKHPIAMVLLDLDHFDRINDTFGHSVGDEVLEKVGGIISDSVRGADVAARVGGEEFAVLLADSSLEDAIDVAERIRQLIETTQFISDDITTIAPSEETEHLPERPLITISAGVAGAPADNLVDAEDLFRAADRALYAAKHAGRNQTARADELPKTAPTYGT